MAASTFNTLYRSIKKGVLSPVYYLTGDEDVLKEEIVNLCVATVLDPAARAFSFDQRYADELDAESFTALVDTPPLLAERRVVWIKGLERWRKNSKNWKALLSYVQDPATPTVLILTQGAGEKPDRTLGAKTHHASIDRLEPPRLARWVADRVHRAGAKLEVAAVEHLIDAVGPDLALLATEIEKIAAVAGDEPVSRREVEELVGVRRGETLVDWVNAVIERRIPQAIELIDVVLSQPGLTGVRVISSLGTVLLGMRIAREHLDRGAQQRVAQDRLLSELRSTKPPGIGNWTSETERWVKAAEKWPVGEIDAAISSAYEADRSLKSTTLMRERDILASMLVEIGARSAQ